MDTIFRITPIEERFMHISVDSSSCDDTHDKLANRFSLKITNHKIAPPKNIHTSIWTCERHALVNDNIGKLSYDIKVSTIFL